MTEIDLPPPRILDRADHPVSRQNISRNTVKVLYRLRNAGFKSFLVGGSVRDLMLGRQPKDYDVGTDARPEQVRKLFKNSRIIGRRFRLVHILFQEGVVEVATFRREPDPEQQASPDGELLITSDNTFGSPREDAFRRDFTINALFYNVDDFSIVDYVDGIDDLQEGVVRAIGDPNVRFQEDPVRMLRACEFAARLDFTIEKSTAQAILDQSRELEKASPARLTEELIQLLRTGAVGSAVQWMLDLGITDVLLPEVLDMLTAESSGFGDLTRILPVVDDCMRGDALRDQQPSDSALVASLLLPKILVDRAQVEEERGRVLRRQEIEDRVIHCLESFLQRFALSNAKSQGLRACLVDFQRLCEPRWTPGQRRRFVNRRAFHDALFLFEVMVEATGEGEVELEQWKEIAPPRPKVEAKPRNRRRRRRRRGDRRSGGEGHGGEKSPDAAERGSGKRRRRRR
ncbi:MAG: polynucleotide adenylyltransferase PcnB [Acidobacteriota bacterium]